MVGTLSFLNTTAGINATNITVDDRLYWSVFPMDLEKRIYRSFNDSSIPLYECMFTRIGLCLPLFDFEVGVLKHLKVSHSQLHLGALGLDEGVPTLWEHKSWKPSLEIFFDLFYMVHIY